MRPDSPFRTPLTRFQSNDHSIRRPDYAEPYGPAQLWSDRLAFLSGFLRDPAGVGAILPSSQRLEHQIVLQADLAHARTVVELGPGTGGTTRALLRAMGPHSRLLAMERDAAFHARLKSRLNDPRLIAVHGHAEHLGAWLTALQWPAPDAIVSGIPFSTLPSGLGARIAQSIAQSLAPGGRFVAYQLRAEVRTVITPLLGPPQHAWIWWNMPPMRVMCWTRRA